MQTYESFGVSPGSRTPASGVGDRYATVTLERLGRRYQVRTDDIHGVSVTLYQLS